jgi:hypothetical protein
MTKQRKTEYIPVPRGKTVHVSSREMMANDAVDMALIEQLYEIKGPATVARLLAWRLRHPAPRHAALDLVARMLDPLDDGYLKLRVVRYRKGKTATKHVNDAAIARAFQEIQQHLNATAKSKHGITSRTVKRVATLFEISPSKVRKAKTPK